MTHRMHIVALLLVAFAALPARAQIVLQETVTGGHADTSPVTMPNIQGGTDQTYVLAIATRNNASVSSVTGGGLTWTEQKAQCSTKNKWGMRIWTAQGSPGGAFQAQISYSDGKPLAAVLSRYTGVQSIIDPTGENPAGEDGSCSDGSKSDPAQLTLTSTDNGSVHVIGVTPGDQTVDSVGGGYSENDNTSYGSGGDVTLAHLYGKEFNPATTDTFQANLSGKTWWATAGVVLSTGAGGPPPSTGPITLEQTVSGGTDQNTSPVTLPSINGGTDQTYVLAIGTNFNRDVTGVTGGGLTWTEQVEQCGTDDQSGMRIWTAQGSPASAFQVQISWDSANEKPLTAILSRYSGVGSIIDPTGENPDGENGSCSATTKNKNVQLTLTSTTDESVHVIGLVSRNRTVDSASSGYTLNGTDAYGTSDKVTNVSLYNKEFDPAATDTFQATLNDKTWWATGGVVLVPGTPSAPLFTDVSSGTGFAVQTTSSKNDGSGLHWADYDNDGDLDVIITGNSAKLLLSANEGASFFSSAFAGGALSAQGAMVDLDNDGDVDFWHQSERLFDNDGNASFTDSGDLGFGDAATNEGTAAADVNGDGRADIVMFSGNGNWIGHHLGTSPVTLVGTADASYGLNDAGDTGDGDFCSSADVNGDGRLDFFFHYGGGKLFLSDGDGTFTENASGISVTTGNNDKIGSAWGDYDNDGDLDLFVPRYDANKDGYLWRNDAGSFTDVTSAAGISDQSGQRSACWGDYDNDGDLDLYVVTRSGNANVLYQNQNDGTFLAVSEGADAAGDGHDAVFVDYDNDGDLDLAVTQEDASNTLLQNGTDDTNYLKVRAIGAGHCGSEKAAIGVRVDLLDSSTSTLLARRDIGVARGYGGTEPLWAHFGGVTPATTYVVRVHFGSGAVDTSVTPNTASTTIGAVTISQMLTVSEPDPPPCTTVVRWVEVERSN